jgi:ssDNA-binding Zn-finger/Zn-ribbon topoisomerase 1
MNNSEFEKRSRDEIRLVRHMQSVLKNGLLGRNEDEVIGEEPTKRYFSGVLFPNYDSFIQQIDNESNSEDPQPFYKSITKNCNLGLEFLVKDIIKEKLAKISGNFNLYLRVVPSYKEQCEALEYFESEETTPKQDTNAIVVDDKENTITSDSEEKIENEINDESNTELDDVPQDKGLKLLHKYRKVKVNFNDLNVKISPNSIIEIDLESFIKKALNETEKWDDLFKVNQKFIDHTSNVPLDSKPIGEESFKAWLDSIILDKPIFPSWRAKIQLETRPYLDDESNSNTHRVIVSLVNCTVTTQVNPLITGHSLEFFDCYLSIDIVDKNVHVPFEFDGAPRDYKYDKRLDVKGINCVGLCNGGTIFETECIPDYFQPYYRTREDIKIKFEDLIQPETTYKSLVEIITEMRKSLIQWKLYIDSGGNSVRPLKTDEEKNQCEKEMKEYEEEICSFELGLYCLTNKSDTRLMKAFNYMNEVFIRLGGGKINSWRLFQIVFIVRILPSLFSREVNKSDPKYNEIMKSSKYADILWFPTGGGKTEAYLGLLICSLFYDRFRGKKKGCTGWLRFPLRMLSKNQLDRLLRAIITAELVREEKNGISEPESFFSIGFFAGGGNTPNFINKKRKDAIFTSEDNKRKNIFIHNCPVCGTPLKFDFNDKRWRFVHKCINPDCEVYKSPVLNGIIPIYITDSEIYRFIPSVLCGTVDKLSIMARYREFSHLFGQMSGKCEEHGYFSDYCVVGKYDEYKSCETKVSRDIKKKMQLEKALFYDPVPSLLIQDELHLLKEELGALDAHYEGALTELSYVFGMSSDNSPKIIAATATIESYEKHVQHLYLRKPRRYPSMGYIYGESFYATSTPAIDRRLYLGVLPHSKSLEEVIGRCLYLYHKEIHRLYENSSKLWNGFGFEQINSNDEFLKLLALYDLSVGYMNKKATGDDVKRRVNEYINPNLKRDTGQTYDLNIETLTGHTSMGDIIKVIERIEAERVGDYSEKLHVLNATSLISHGVDLERINALFMAGMPSKQAEYIQASSRSARNHAGLVIVCFKSSDIRERSQYQYFIQNHIFMDRLVDPVPINRVSLKVIERSLPGLLSTLLLCVHSNYHTNTIFDCNQYVKYIAESNVSGKQIEQVLISQLKSIIGTKSGFFTKAVCEKIDRFIENEFNKLHHILCTSTGSIKNVLEPITSFRDIEEGIELSANIDTAILLSIANRGKEE